MSASVEEIKAFVCARLDAHMHRLPPKTANSEEKHLSVWTLPGFGRPIGAELGHETLINFWVLTFYAPTALPPTVEIKHKVWNGSGWKDKAPVATRRDRDGANSNLKPFEVFNTRPITRLGVKSIEDARVILDQLLS